MLRSTPPAYQPTLGMADSQPADQPARLTSGTTADKYPRQTHKIVKGGGGMIPLSRSSLDPILLKTSPSLPINKTSHGMPGQRDPGNCQGMWCMCVDIATAPFDLQWWDLPSKGGQTLPGYCPPRVGNCPSCPFPDISPFSIVHNLCAQYCTPHGNHRRIIPADPPPSTPINPHTTAPERLWINFCCRSLSPSKCRPGQLNTHNVVASALTL